MLCSLQKTISPARLSPLLPALLVCGLVLSAAAQTTVQGRVEDGRTGKPVPNVTVYFLLKTALTDEAGRFSFETALLEQEVLLSFERSGYQTKTVIFLLSGQKAIDIGIIPLLPQEDLDLINAEDFIPTITLETGAVETAGGESISGVLTASRDVFVATAAFNFGAARFRLRGYDARNTPLYLNGLPVNDLESGYVSWSNWGGLNDVLRNRANVIGLDDADFSFGGPGGASQIDLRASRQRRQLRVSYAASDRTYRNRVMGTLSTGALPNGWSATISGSRRWAGEGYLPGTVYDAWSYFLSLSKQLGSRHELNLTAFGAPLTRGLSSAATEELYDLAGSKYYNPNWGYQVGEKRNARLQRTHQPTALLRHDWKWSDKTTLTTTAGYQFGRDGRTALNWYDARDPRPDYYRRLPSFIDNEQRDAVEEAYRTDESVRQIDWAYLYEVNRNNVQSVENADGIPGNTITGQRAQYLLEDRRYDSRQYGLNTLLQSSVGNRMAIVAGLSLQGYDSDNFKLVDDLLDANFYLDIDRFAEFDNPTDPLFVQNDLSRTNRVVQEGDTFDYHYAMHLRRGAVWLQTQFSLPRVDFFIAGEASTTSFWREGYWANGKFPTGSKGASERPSFFNYGAKGGLTFKVNGRNYLVANAFYQTRAPFMRDAFLSPRTRNQLAPALRSERLYGAEASYLYRGPYAKLRLTGYYTRFDDQLFNRSFYLDNALVGSDGDTQGGFVNYLMQGINTQHFGLEAGGELTLMPGLRLSAVAALGQYTYVSRPKVTVFLDQRAEQIREYTAYIRNFYVPNTPQTALGLGLSYNAPGFWFVNVNLNYFDDIWIDFNPDRRTTEAVSYSDKPEYGDDVVPRDSDLWKRIIYQEKAPRAITLDFFGGKSWKIGEVFLYLNAGVNNILDKQDFIIGGYEQFRFDYETKNVDRFPNRYFYSFGRTYFAQLALRI